jgi:ABC-2 type transport system ATP-binding protein
MNALDVDAVSHSFGKLRILDNVSFSVPEGGFAALLGANGAGKTTLISLVTRLYHARSGTISIFGHPLRHEPMAALAAVGIVFQMATLDLDLSVAANLRYHGALHDLTRRQAGARGEEELARLGVDHLMGRQVRGLSGGERRRIEIARALMHRPRLLIADEATAGLDPDARLALVAYIRDLSRQRGLAVLWATHLTDEIAATDLVLELRDGTAVRRQPQPDPGRAPIRAAPPPQRVA